ncbi:MAG: ATP synthase F1 subunit delta [Phycisphaeraceae bacterium]
MNDARTQTDAVDRAYARALFETGVEQGELEALADEMEELGDVIADQPELRRLITTPAIGVQQRVGLIDRLFKDRVSPTLYKFLQVVTRKGRLASLPGMVQAFAELMTDQRGLVEVDIFVADRLNEAQADDVANSIGRVLGREVVLHQYVDPELIGGLKIRVGDKLIDGSVANQLKLLRQRLGRVGRDRAREAE